MSRFVGFGGFGILVVLAVWRCWERSEPKARYTEKDDMSSALITAVVAVTELLLVL